MNTVGAGVRFEVLNKLLLAQTRAIALIYTAGTRNKPPVCKRAA